MFLKFLFISYYNDLSNRKEKRTPPKKLYPRNLTFFLSLKEKESDIRMFEIFEDHYIIKSVGFKSSGGRAPPNADLVYRRNLDFASSPCSRFVRKYGVEKLATIKFHQSVRGSEIQSLLLDGLKINGEQFSFLGCSTSGLKERKAYLWRGSPAEAEAVLLENGEFDKLKTVSKRMAREGLLFSAIDYTGVDIEWENIIEQEDIEFNGYNFTDGCGEMSESLARRVYQTIPSLENQCPSVLQIRLQEIYPGFMA